MSTERKVGIMIDSGAIESNLTHMTDAIRNANYKAVVASGLQQNADGEYVDADGDNLIMEEGVVKALLQDAVDSYLVAALPGRNKADPQEFSYYLWDSFPNVAEYIQKEPRISTYVSALFANTCGLLANSLLPAIKDITDHGQTLGHIETFCQGPSTSYYLLIGEDPEVVDTDESHTEAELRRKLPIEERRERDKIELIKELGIEGYEKFVKKQSDLKDDEKFTDYVGILDKCLTDAINSGEYPRSKFAFGRYYSEGPTHLVDDHGNVVETIQPDTTQINVTWTPPPPNPHNTKPTDIRPIHEPANLFAE